MLEYIKFRADNNPVEVLKLQTFLRDYEGFANIPVTGVYDQVTFDALSAFQVKYRKDILEPWGHTKSTGYVYITTKKKVNEIYCGKAIALTANQQAEIDAFKILIAKLEAEKQAGDQSAEKEIEKLQGEIGKVDATSTSAIGVIEFVGPVSSIGKEENKIEKTDKRGEWLVAAISFAPKIDLTPFAIVLILLLLASWIAQFLLWRGYKKRGCSSPLSDWVRILKTSELNINKI